MAKAQIGGIVIPCASRKRWAPAEGLRAADLGAGRQPEVSASWLARLHDTQPRGPARDLYMGRGFALGRQAAAGADVPMFVISAGLGLVDGATRVPPYGLTVGMRGEDAVSARVSGRFDPHAWWQEVSRGPFSTRWDKALARDGVVLVALSQAYARMIAADLATMDAAARSRFRLFGTGLETVLPGQFASQVMPYDERFDAIVPGTRADFAQRALRHFATEIAASVDPGEDAAEVARMLSRHEAPARVERPRADDEAVIRAISAHLRDVSGIGRVLRRVRDHDLIACEQRRFTRLYRIAETRIAPARHHAGIGDAR